MRKLLTGWCRLLCCTLVLLPTLMIANVYWPTGPTTDHRHSTTLVQRVQQLDLPLHVQATDDFTRRKIDEYLQYGGRSTERMLGRANAYFPVFEHYLRRHGLPASLKYLAVAESLLVPNATSPVSAAGLWQLMPETARYMGLRVDSIVDERLDIHRATEAAMLMLRDLHAEFGNWRLAMAAYNAGPGRVQDAIERAGTYEYERVREFLPAETRRYVAAYVAAAYAVNYYGDHGLSPRDLAGTKFLRIHRPLGLNKLARSTGIRLATLVRLNPAFQRGYIPASERGYLVRLPASHYDAAREFMWGRTNLVMLPREENLEAAEVLAERDGYDPYAVLFGVPAARRGAYERPGWQVSELRDRMLMGYLAEYRAVASL